MQLAAAGHADVGGHELLPLLSSNPTLATPATSDSISLAFSFALGLHGFFSIASACRPGLVLHAAVFAAVRSAAGSDAAILFVS